MTTRRTTTSELEARVEELEGVVHSLRAQVVELVGVCSSKCRCSATREVLAGNEGDKVDRKLIAEGEGGVGGSRATRRDSSETREALGGAKRVEADRELVVEEGGSGEEGADDVDGMKVGTVTGEETRAGGAEKEKVEVKERGNRTVAQVVRLVSSYTQTESVVAQTGVWDSKSGSRFLRPQQPKQDSKDETNKGEWRKAKSGGRQDLVMSIPAVRLENRFSVLASVDDSGKEEVDTLVIGDSRVRPLRRAFGGGRDRCVVKPGARVADVDSAVGTELSRYSPNRVVVQVGVNNIGPRASVKLVKDYHSLLQRLSEARKPVYVTGVLPRLRASSEWHSRALALNSSVRKMCKDMGLHFVDLWDEFYGNNRYYLWDGLHLSDEGARVLAAKYRGAFQGN